MPSLFPLKKKNKREKERERENGRGDEDEIMQIFLECSAGGHAPVEPLDLDLDRCADLDP